MRDACAYARRGDARSRSLWLFARFRDSAGGISRCPTPREADAAEAEGRRADAERSSAGRSPRSSGSSPSSARGRWAPSIKATQLNLKKRVAIKVMHPDKKDATYVSRFKREAKAAARMEHPNLLRVIDFGEEPDGLLYIAMEFLDGRDLLTVLREEFPFSDGADREHHVADARRARRRARDGGRSPRSQAREHHAPPVEGRRGARDRAREGVRLRRGEDHPRGAGRRGRRRRDPRADADRTRRPGRSPRTARSSARPSTCRPSRRAASRPTRGAICTRWGSSCS